MRRRLPPALVASLALFAAAPPLASAQDPAATPTPTPTATATPTPTPTPEPQRRSKAVRAVYRDFRRDGQISACRHTLKDLKRAKKTLDDAFAEEFPDFEPALDAAIDERRDCVEEAEGTPTPTPTPTATATASPTATATATPAPTAAPTASPDDGEPESGLLPGGTGGDGGGGARNPAGSGPEPTVITPVPTPAPPAAAPAAPVPTPVPLAVTRPAADRSLALPGILFAIALLGSALLALSAFAAQRSPRLAGMRHAWAEAALRTRGTWADFADWMRLGR